MKRLVLALGRNAETEVTGGGASVGTQYLFSSMEQELRQHFTVVTIPPYYYATQARPAFRVAIDVLTSADVCLFGMACPFDLEPFFLVRERLQKKTPFIYMPLGEFPRGAWFYRNIYRHLRPQDLMLFSSRADRAIHDILVATTPARLTVIPFGIDAQFFRRSATLREATRRHLGISDGDVVFVYHGRVTAEKNIHGALMTFRRIAEEYPGTHLWIVGGLSDCDPQGFGPHSIAQLSAHPLADSFRELLLREDVQRRVLFWGNLTREALPRILGAADIAVSFTLNGDENFGYGVVEAMAAGLPVIGTEWGGLRDTIEHQSTGFLVPTLVTPIGVGIDHWSAFQLARTLVEDAGLRKRMGAAAARRATSAFALDRFINSVAAEVRAQVVNRCKKRRGPHAWSALGKQLAKTYSRNVAGNRKRKVPIRVPAAMDLFAEHPLMRRVILPYATQAHVPQLSRDAVFFLATELMHIGDDALVSRDPRYPFEFRPTDAVDVSVVRILYEQGFCRLTDVALHIVPGAGTKAARTSLQRLLRAGIVLQSRARIGALAKGLPK